ncbi:thioredoxin-like protein [Phycomyces nitens]|nr:thioredoxin-like protein [Phycomyces nitens]
MACLFDYQIKDIKRNEWDLEELRGKVVLFVNVASKCSFTKQYDALEKLYNTYKDRGLVVVGCPCNQFANQEPGTEEEIHTFCRLTYNVSFPLTSKIEVNGKDEHPIYRFLKDSYPGFLGLRRIKWNFEKFLINREGKVVKRFFTFTDPKSIANEIEKCL